MAASQKRLLKPDEVAQRLGVARKTIIVWAREQRIPHVRIGRYVRFDPETLERWLDSRRS